MKRLIYKDQVYFFKVYQEKTTNSYYTTKIHLYVEREGFWSRFFKYKKINCPTEIYLMDSYWKPYLINEVDNYLKRTEEARELQKNALPETLVINCSPEIEALYR